MLRQELRVDINISMEAQKMKELLKEVLMEATKIMDLLMAMFKILNPVLEALCLVYVSTLKANYEDEDIQSDS